MIYRYRLHDHDNFQTRSINGIVFTKQWQDFDHPIDFGPFRLLVMEETKASKTATAKSVKPDIIRMGKDTLIEYIMKNRQDLTKTQLRQSTRSELVDIAKALSEK